jgi:hypothetical protein
MIVIRILAPLDGPCNSSDGGCDIGLVTIHWEWLGHPNLDLLFNNIYNHNKFERSKL